MGGSTVKDTFDTVKGVASDAVAASTAGFVDLENGKINTNPEDAAKNFVRGATGGNTMRSLMPEMPKLPTPEDPNAQDARAKAEAEKKMNAELGTQARGLSSTILGGSTGDDSVLKKKRLLGE